MNLYINSAGSRKIRLEPAALFKFVSFRGNMSFYTILKLISFFPSRTNNLVEFIVCLVKYMNKNKKSRLKNSTQINNFSNNLNNLQVFKLNRNLVNVSRIPSARHFVNPIKPFFSVLEKLIYIIAHV